LWRRRSGWIGLDLGIEAEGADPRTSRFHGFESIKQVKQLEWL
jgi:hypothetical protein